MHIPKSFIKNVAIQLPSNYRLSNSPYEIKGKNVSSGSQCYIGRESHMKKFNAFLESSTKGVYLVTGYRGMGKTSFVNNVLNKYKNSKTEWKQERIYPIHLTIAQSNPKEIDVLRQVVSSISDQYKPGKAYEYISKLITVVTVIILVGCALKILSKVEKTEAIYIAKQITVWRILLSALFLAFLHYVRTFVIKEDAAFLRIKKLMERCHSSVTMENSIEDNTGLGGLVRKFSSRKGRTYPIADSKEIEYELLEFLKLTKKKGLEFIFIFDELDKIELNQTGINLNEDLESYEYRNKGQNDINPLRNRRQAVLNIITGLKNFFTTANARFVFIAGREMFDASLADIADKQSPLSSIFTYTFHIESLFKELGKDRNYTTLTVGVEEFLAHQILSASELENTRKRKQREGKEKDITIDDILICLKGQDIDNDRDYLQAYFVLQNFVSYLLYRSSGSPKKLIKIFQEFVNVGRDFDLDAEFITLIERDCCDTKPCSCCYLYFNYPNQYRFGFINSIYKPYIVQYSRIYKSFSENTVISVPYIFDHLFKFHDFAFSVSNLELIPEAISYNKSTSLGGDLRKVIEYLFQSHIRDTDIELFDYKFYSKTAHEVMFISKIFEDEAAAFNFTLDESYPIKAILNEKIKEHRSIHSKFNVDPEKLNPQIFSIANLNSSLGDICFFDKEFHEAINCYSDVIRPINNRKIEEMNLRDFITLVRNKLKIGLCFEKINSYEEALAFYSDSLQDIKRYLSFVLVRGKYIDDFKSSFPDDYMVHSAFYTSSLNDVLQICVQSFLANIFIQEKMGLEGMSSPKIKVDLADFLRIIDGVANHTGRNHLIIANSMLHHGKMLYYKNTPGSTPDSTNNSNSFPEWFDEKYATIKKYFNDKAANIRRQPILAFKIYMIGLDETMRSRNCFTKNKLYGKFIYSAISRNAVNTVVYDKVGFLNRYLDNLKLFSKSNSSRSNKEDFTANHYKSIAGFLSSIGDSVLGMDDMKALNNTYHISLGDIFDLNSKRKTDIYDYLLPNTTGKFALTDVLRCYYLSAVYYEKYGRLNSAIFEYKKIIHVLMIVTRYEQLPNNESYIELLKTHIVNKALELARNATSRTERHHILKSEYIIKSIKDTKIKDNHIYDDVRNNRETNEIELFFEYLKVKTYHPDTISSTTLEQDGYIETFVNSHYLISSQYQRVISMDFYKSYLYRKIKDREQIRNRNRVIYVKYEEILEFKKELLEFVFSINEISRILKIYDTNYFFGPSYLAYMHYSLANLLNKNICHEIESAVAKTKVQTKTIKVREFIENDDYFPFMDNLTKILGGKPFAAVDIQYHYGKARDKYILSTQLHTAGLEYRNQIRDMIYLEDDFNDNAYHFGAAIERYLMVNNFFTRKIKEIDEELAKI